MTFRQRYPKSWWIVRRQTCLSKVHLLGATQSSTAWRKAKQSLVLPPCKAMVVSLLLLLLPVLQLLKNERTVDPYRLYHFLERIL
jgi:hypothetical protein